MRERRSDALPSRMLRAFRGSGRQAKEAKLRDRAVSAEAAMFAIGDPLVARPTGRWTEGRVSGTRQTWPQGRRLFLREKHRPRKRQELPFAGDAARAWRSVFFGSTGTRPEARGPCQRADGFSFGETVFPARQQNPFAGGAAWTRRPGFLGGGARESKARVGARDRSSGKAAPLPKGAGPPPARHRLARDVALLKRSNARHAFGARGRPGSRGVRGCPARTPAGFPSQRPDAPFFTIWPTAAPLDFVVCFALRHI